MDIDKMLTEGFKLNLEERGLLIRAAMVTIVAVHILWVCGWFAVLGIPSPFVEAGEIQKVIAAQKFSIDSKVAELDDQIHLEELRKQKDSANWGEVDELKLSQLKRRYAEHVAQQKNLEKALAEKTAAANKKGG